MSTITLKATQDGLSKKKTYMRFDVSGKDSVGNLYLPPDSEFGKAKVLKVTVEIEK